MRVLRISIKIANVLNGGWEILFGGNPFFDAFVRVLRFSIKIADVLNGGSIHTIRRKTEFFHEFVRVRRFPMKTANALIGGNVKLSLSLAKCAYLSP